LYVCVSVSIGAETRRVETATVADTSGTRATDEGKTKNNRN